MNALTDKFVPTEWRKLFKSELQTHRRASNEKLVDLSSAIAKLARKAFPGAPSDLVNQLAKDRFVEALCNRELRIKIHKGLPKTLDEAVSRAIQLESIYEAESGKTISTKPIHVVQPQCNHHPTDDGSSTMQPSPY